MKNRVISILLTLTMCVSCPAVPAYAQELPELYSEEKELVLNGLAEASSDASIDGMIARALEWKRGGKFVVMDDVFLSGVSSTATDWDALALGRLGVEDNYGGFRTAAASYVAEKYAQNPKYGLSANTATEWHRLTVALLAAGGDPLNVGGQNLIRDGVYDCLIGAPWRQGTNGAVWALIALDSFGYEVPEGASYDRGDLIQYLLDNEKSGGGWALSSILNADADITAMAVQALAPYYTGNEGVKAAVDRGLDFLRSCQKDDGDVSSSKGGKGSSEATCQAILAFCSMGQNPDGVVSGSGKSLLDGLKKYGNPTDGGFYHDIDLAEKGSDGMATQQALYTLAGYQRYVQGKTNLYDFRAAAKTEQYQIRAGGKKYLLDARNSVLALPLGTKAISIENLPIGNYESAVIAADGKNYQSSYRRADGSTPVDEKIPVNGVTILTIHVTALSGKDAVWTLTIAADGEIDDETAAGYVEEQIDALPDTNKLTLADETKVAEAREAYDALTENQKALVKNAAKLTAAEQKLAELKEGAQGQLEADRKSLKKKIEAIQEPVKISQKKEIQQYLQELEELGEWSEKAALKNKLNGYLKEITVMEKAVEQLDADIWNQIHPLAISQKDTGNVKSLMQRYAAFTKEERRLLKNAQSLLDAADIIGAFEDGIIPEKVFQNMMSTKEDFTYYGTDASGRDYQLIYNAASVKMAEDVNAKAKIVRGSDGVRGALASVELYQQGSLNGNVTFICELGIDEGSHQLYWLDTDSLSIKSAGKASVNGAVLTMDVSRGGSYWISDSVVSMRKDTAVESEAADKKADSKKSKDSQKKTTKTNLVKALLKSGTAGKNEFKKVMGKDENLQIAGLYGARLPYTFTFYGKDIKEAVDFNYEIQSECSHAEEICRLAEEPFLLCMEKTGPFPGEALLTLETNLDDGMYLLFLYNQEEMKAEYVKKLEISDGKTMFTLSEGGDYFIAKRAKSGSLKEEAEETKTTDAVSGTEDAQWDESKELAVSGTAAPTGQISLLMLLGAAIMAAGVCLGYMIGKNKNSSKEKEKWKE